MTDQNAIAVVGLAGRFPEARDVGEFWENLVDGRECMSDLTYEDVLARGESRERLDHPSYVLRRPLLPDMEWFDAGFFGMTPREAELRDPQHRIFLEVCYTALEHAGYDSSRYEGAIGLYAGINGNRYEDLYLRKHPGLVDAVGELTLETSNHPDYVTTFTSYKLGLRGPSMTVATACSSSLVSVHQASQALRAGECDMALAGGVEVEWPYGHGYVHSPGGIYPPDGYCRPFDVAAEGTVFGSGAGVVLLKRYADAVADGDTVYGLILGSAVNNDGDDKVGFSAPSVGGQAACVAEALAAARVDPRTVSYVEAHGTATRLGDPIEVTALTRAFRAAGDGVTPGSCGIGSVKSNVGHLGPASGVAGLIKTVLSLHHETLPPSINFSRPNPELKLEETPFEVVDTRRAWPREVSAPRRAGVSSFGIGGTNAHVVLEEAPLPAPAAADDGPELLLVSGRTPTALGKVREDLARHLAWNQVSLRDAAHTLRTGRRAFAVRDAVVASSVQGAVDALGGPPPAQAEPLREVVLAFPGQGSQRPGMAAGLYARHAGFRARLDQNLADFSDVLERDLGALWRDGDEAELARTDVAQPLLFSLGEALAATLRQTGVPVTAVIGHSLGEITAATVAGVFTREDAVRVVAERARLMQGMPPGAMAAVQTSERDVEALLGDGLSLAAVNAPQQVVLSGAADAIEAACEKLRAAGTASRLLRTSHAYHSELMRDAVEPFRAVVEGVARRRPDLCLISCATGAAEEDALLDPGFWAGQLTTPVRFRDAATELLKQREQVAVLETGPGAALTELLRGSPQVRRGRALPRPVLRGDDPDDEYSGFLRVLGDLWCAGLDLNLCELSGDAARRVALPGYPFERKRHFIDHPVQPADDAVAPVGEAAPAPAGTGPTASTASRSSESAAAPTAREADDGSGHRDPDLWEVSWARVGRPERTWADYATRTDALVVLPEDAVDARRVLSLVQRGGLRPVRLYPPGAGGVGAQCVDLTDRDAVFTYVGDLARHGRLPGTVVYAPLYGDGDLAGTDHKAVVHSLLWLVQAVQRYRGEAGLDRFRLVVLTRHGADVTGGEPLVPAKALPSGLLRTLEQEIPGSRFQWLDIADRSSTETVVAVLRDERHQTAAVRGSDLWLPAVRPLTWDEAPRRPLRRRGVYLITGGLGGLGRVAAQALAYTGTEPRIALLGRAATLDGDTEAARSAREFVDELTASGAEVEVIGASVADPGQLASALQRVREVFGPVNGVLHAAGVAGDGLAELRTREQADAVLRPKVDGGTVLHAALEDERDVDFVVHYGSRAALTGLVGSGDYAAANAYLNALAAVSSGGDQHVVSVNWPGWDEVGMAVQGGGTAPATVPGEVTVEAEWDGTEWFTDEHRIGGEPVLPGTGHVDLILSAAVRSGHLPHDEPLAVTDLAFVAPLPVSPGTIVQVAFRPEGEGYAVTVRSRSRGAVAFTEHARAAIAIGDEKPARAELSDFYQRAAEGEPLAVNTQGSVVAFGPRWKNVRTAVRSGADLLAELTLPEEYHDDLAAHRAHPALLDTATSLVQAASDEPYLPFYYQRAVFFRPLPADVVVTARETGRSADTLVSDITVYDPRGRELARVTGFTMRRVDPDTFAAEITAARPRRAAPAPVRSPDGPGLLSPEEGAALLLRVLERPGPSSLVVLRHGEHLAGHVVLDGAVEAASGWPTSADEPPVPVAVPVAAATAAPLAPAPVTSGGPAEDATRAAADAGYDPRLRVLWEELTGVTEIGADEDFFQDVGGNSLAAVQLVSRIRETFGVQLSVGQIFETGTLRHMSEEIRRYTTDPA